MTSAATAKRGLIVDSTPLIARPLTPEIRLWLADEAVPIWRKTEETSWALPPPYWAFAWAGGQAHTSRLSSPA